MKLHEMDLTKKIRRKEWDEHQFIHSPIGHCIFFNELGKEYLFDRYEMPSDDWTYFDEPKKKKIVKMWPAVRNGALAYIITDEIFRDEKQAAMSYPGTFIRLATEYPAIEIEVEDE